MPGDVTFGENATTSGAVRAGLNLAFYRELPSDPEFRQQWDALALSVENPQVFYTWEWAKAVCDAYHPDLLLFAASREGRLEGLAAFALVSRNEVEFLTGRTADYCDLLSSRDDREELAQLVLQALHGLGIRDFRLANLPADSASVKALKRAARKNGFFSFFRHGYFCAQISLGSEQERQHGASSARRTARRKAKALKHVGLVKVAHHEDWKGFSSGFERFASSQIGRFLEEGKLSNLIRPERRDFLQRLGSLLSERGWLAMSTLTVENQAYAWNFGMRFAGTWFWYQPAFDTEMEYASPGAHLLSEIILAASHDADCKVVDLGLGEEKYKKNHTHAGRRTLFVCGRSRAHKAAWDVLRYSAASVARKSEKAEVLIRAGLQRIVPGDNVQGGLVQRGLKWLKCRVNGRSDVHFFSRPGGVRQTGSGLNLAPISIHLLSRAAMAYADDDDTLRFLLRSAGRLRQGDRRGYALLNGDAVPIHFGWTSEFSKVWISELGRRLTEPQPNATLVYDCWTPLCARGQGYYSHALRLVAEQLRDLGAIPWIFSAAGNQNSIRGIERAGFERRFSVTHRTRFAFLHQWRQTSRDDAGHVMDFNPAA